VPDRFFSDYLQDRLSPLATKVFLHVLWRIHRREAGTVPAYRLSELVADEAVRRGIGAAYADESGASDADESAASDADESAAPVADESAALDPVIRELEGVGLLLTARVAGDHGPETWLFVNTEEGRLAHDEWRAGGLVLPELPAPVGRVTLDRAEIFSLYEDNIGMLTPMIAEELAEADDLYPTEWLVDAFRIAVEQNARSWSYVNGILERWAREGRGDETDRRRDQAARERDIEGPYSTFIEH
jgi:DnaD/phage-associated family protein